MYPCTYFGKIKISHYKDSNWKDNLKNLFGWRLCYNKKL